MAPQDGTQELHGWIATHRRVFVLSGAGCSTASGIPDYRDEQGAWKRRPPVMFHAFRTQEATYRRYWARAYAGWPRFTAAEPGAAHHALAAWERTGTLARLVTQNVDGLHQRAGSRAVIDLHGRLDVVVCLGCGMRTSRDAVQDAMTASNAREEDFGCVATRSDHSGWLRTRSPVPAQAPDGDADVDAAAVELFEPPRCTACGGLLKPDVVFFGENVPTRRYEDARDALAGAEALLVAGSSLMVYSGFRFVRQAHEAGLPIAIVNRGRTRGDEFADLKVEGDVGTLLTDVLGAVTARE